MCVLMIAPLTRFSFISYGSTVLRGPHPLYAPRCARVACSRLIPLSRCGLVHCTRLGGIVRHGFLRYESYMDRGSHKSAITICDYALIDRRRGLRRHSLSSDV